MLSAEKQNVEVVESMCIKEPTDPKFFVVQARALHLNVKNWVKVEESCVTKQPQERSCLFLTVS